jgi:hypothetical protein
LIWRFPRGDFKKDTMFGLFVFYFIMQGQGQKGLFTEFASWQKRLFPDFVRE